MENKNIELKLMLTPAQLLTLKGLLFNHRDDSDVNSRLYNKFLYGILVSLTPEQIAVIKSGSLDESNVMV